MAWYYKSSFEITKTTLKLLILILLLFNMQILPSFVEAYSSKKNITTTGTVSYVPSNMVNINSNNIIWRNSLSLGVQVDGPSISKWTNQIALRTMTKDANIKFIRFFEHRLGKPCSSWNENTKTGTFDWSKIDKLVKQIYEIGAEPLIVLGFYSWTLDTVSSAPSGMSVNQQTGLPYPDQWGAYCAAWVKHFKEVGLPVKYYEIINEPYHYFDWPATEPKLGYFMSLYKSASIEMKKINSSIKIGNDASTLKSVLDAFIRNGGGLDFISFHKYGITSLEQTDSQALNNAETLYLTESKNVYSPLQAKTVYKKSIGADLIIINSEGNLSSKEEDVRTHTMVGAVYAALTLKSLIFQNVSYSTYFHIGGKETNMGMINTDTLTPYYPYFVHKYLGDRLKVGDPITESSSTSQNIRVLSWINSGKTNILIISKSTQKMTILINGVSGDFSYLKMDESIPWASAAVQEGRLNVENMIAINGYTVMLLQSI